MSELVREPLVPEPSRLALAMNLIAEEVMEMLASPARFEPQVFARIDKLMRICKAIKHQMVSVDLRLAPHERAAARGFGCVMPGVDRGDLELGLGD